MNLSPYTLALLDDIERRIDPEVEDDLYAQWKAFWNGEITAPVFTPERKKVTAIGTELKKININDALTDVELMLDRELEDVCRKLSSQSKVLGIRANYGTGILSSVFGADIFMMDRIHNTLPTTRASPESELRKIVEKGRPDIMNGLGRKVFEFAEFLNEALKPYPKIRQFVRVYHPDLQGPLDICELLWGSGFFYALYDDPDFVHSFLSLITNT